MTELSRQDELIARLKGAFSGHELIEVAIAVTQFNKDASTKNLMAVKLSEGWALHPSLDEYGWTCTHLPSGYCTGWWPTTAHALMSLGAIMSAGIDWDTFASNDDLRREYEESPEKKTTLLRGLAAIKNLGTV